MTIQEAQEKIKKFDIARGWDNKWSVKDLLLNITEEGGELWSLIKWVDKEKQKNIMEQHNVEASDYIGDTLFLILKIANQMGVNADKALQDTLDEYEERMPAEKMKEVGHANTRAGGIDDKKCQQ